MTLELYRTQLTDLDAVATLLTSVFNTSADSVFVNREHLRWKYLEPGPQWEGSRSYVLRKNHQIHAHCAVWPLNLHVGDSQISCLCYIDWANRSEIPGAGFMLKKKLMKLSDTSIVVGGSAETREIVPKLGFAHVSDVASFARVVRPWKQYRTRPAEPISQGAARLVRNTSWSLFSRDNLARNWSAKRVKSFSPMLDFNPPQMHPMPWRGPDYLNYWLRCSAAEVSGFEMFRAGNSIGYFLLSLVGRQMRIADIRVNSEDPGDWQNAYSLAAMTAAEHPETCEILASASIPLVAECLKGSGFRHRGSSPLFLYDPKKRLAGYHPMFWNMIEGDAAYLHDPTYPYVT